VSLIDFSSAQSGKAPVRKRIKIAIGIFALVGATTLGTTLASNISLNGGANVEFGQGIATTTACDSNVVLTPTSTFVNSESDGEFMFTSVSVSDISESCFGKNFTIKAYKNGQSEPLDLYITGFDGGPYDTYSEIQVLDSSGNFILQNAGLLGDDITSDGSDNFTVTFVTDGPPPSEALTSARDVDRITIESFDGITPVAYWNFNDAATLGNSVLSNFNLFSCGSPTQGTGLNGSGGLQLDGNSFLTSSYVQAGGPRQSCDPGGFVSTPDQLLGNATYTMSAWFKTSSGSTQSGIVAWGIGGCGLTTNLRFWGSFNGFADYWYACDLVGNVPNSTAFDDDEWHFIVSTYDGQTRKMYFDGELFTFDNPGFAPDFQDSQFLIGATIADAAFTGTLDNVGVYSIALTAEQISNLYQARG
jgi:hypothetical protein